MGNQPSNDAFNLKINVTVLSLRVYMMYKQVYEYGTGFGERTKTKTHVANASVTAAPRRATKVHTNVTRCAMMSDPH